MKPNQARPRSCRPPSLYAMSSKMVLKSFGQRPRLALKYDTLMRIAGSSGSHNFNSLPKISPRMSSGKAPGSSIVRNVPNNGSDDLTNDEQNVVSDQELKFEDMASSSSCSDCPLASLWDSLTIDMQALVFSNLSFLDLITLRCVCKKWNDIILFSNCPHGMHENLSPKCVPLHFDEGFLVIFNSKKNLWEEQSLGFLPLPPESLSLEVCSRGLLCFRELSSGDFIVCNPITKRWKRVPLPPGITHDNIRGIIARSHRPVPTKEGGKAAIDAFLRSYGKEVVVGIINDRHSKSYKLVVAGILHGDHRGTLLYDSVTNLWKNGGDVPRGVRFWESGKVVYSHGYFYCITYSIGLPKGHCDLDQPWSVIRYDVGSDTWSQVKIIRRGTVLSQLVEHNGRVMLLQRHFSQGNYSNEITFSQFDEESGTLSWLQAKTLPLEFFSADKARSSQIIEDWCVGQGDLLYVARQERECDGSSKKNGRNLAMLAHDFTRDSWTKLPTLNLHGGYYPARSLHVIEPSLAALP